MTYLIKFIEVIDIFSVNLIKIQKIVLIGCPKSSRTFHVLYIICLTKLVLTKTKSIVEVFSVNIDDFLPFLGQQINSASIKVLVF